MSAQLTQSTLLMFGWYGTPKEKLIEEQKSWNICWVQPETADNYNLAE